MPVGCEKSAEANRPRRIWCWPSRASSLSRCPMRCNSHRCWLGQSPPRRSDRLSPRGESDPPLLGLESALEPAGRGYAVCRVPQPRPDVTEGPGLPAGLRNRAQALTAAAHDNETAALSLFEQPFCSGVQGAKVTLLRVRALRRIAKSSGPTAGGQRIDRTGDLVAAKCNEERAGADTRGLSGCRVVLGTLQEVTVRHHGRVQTIVTGPAASR